MGIFKFNIVIRLLVACFASSIILSGQSYNIDSIKIILSKLNEKDRPHKQLQFASEIATFDFKMADKLAREALNYYLKNKNKSGIAKCYTTLGDIYMNNNSIDDAIKFFREAYQIEKDLGNTENVAYLLNGLGMCFYYSNNLKEAKSYFFQARNIAKGKSPKEEASALNSIGSCYRREGQPDSAKYYFLQSLHILKDKQEDKLQARTYQNIGLIEFEQGNYEQAIYNYQQAKEIRDKLGDLQGKAILLNNIGNVYYSWGKYQQAAVNYQQALEIFEKIGFNSGLASAYTNLGTTFIKLRDYNTARDYLEKALQERKKSDNKLEIANAYINLANLFSQINHEENKKRYGENWEKIILKHLSSAKVLQQYKTSLLYNEEALKLSNEIGNKRIKAMSLNNIGTIYSLAGLSDKALEYYNQALQINREIGNLPDVVINLFAIGIIHSSNGNYENALRYFNESLKIAQQIQRTETEKDIYYNLSVMYENMGNSAKALEYYKNYARLKDTLLNKETFKQIAELKTKYETEKKQKEIELLSKDQKLKENQIRQQRMAIIFFIILTLVISSLIVLLIRQNEQRKRTNKALAEKNALITEQKKEITDSIQYASRIQRAILPPDELVQQVFSDYFILYRPRDIVSGDFYFVAQHANKTIVAAADCTGHGVPGAFMSMLGMALLQEIIGKLEELRADIILNELRRLLIRSLHQNQMSYSTRDGMDMSLYIIDNQSRKISFAGANNPLIIVRDGEVFELKADRMPIGIYEKMDMAFTEKTFDAVLGDMIYSYSDGFQDQFGGPEGKKFMSKRLKELLASCASLPCTQQIEIIEKSFHEWKGDNPQIDDVLVIGVRV